MFYILNAPPSPFRPTPEGHRKFIAQSLLAIDHMHACLEHKQLKKKWEPFHDVLDLPKFAADLSAIARIGLWEKSNERQYLDHRLPPYEQALDELKTRVLSNPDGFFGEEPATTYLHELVADAGNRSFHFSIDLQAVLLVAEPDEDVLIDAVAQLLLDRSNPKKGRTDA